MPQLYLFFDQFATFFPGYFLTDTIFYKCKDGSTWMWRMKRPEIGSEVPRYIFDYIPRSLYQRVEVAS